jgi:hypothetical protein
MRFLWIQKAEKILATNSGTPCLRSQKRSKKNMRKYGNTKFVILEHMMKGLPGTFVMGARKNEICELCHHSIPVEREIIFELESTGFMFGFCTESCWLNYWGVNTC